MSKFGKRHIVISVLAYITFAWYQIDDIRHPDICQAHHYYHHSCGSPLMLLLGTLGFGFSWAFIYIQRRR